MRFPAFLFEVMDKMPTVEYMYLSGIILALLVFAATYFHRQVGLMSLLLVSLLCVQDVESPEIVEAANKAVIQGYVAHWNYSCRMTFILSVILFFTAIILKRKMKQKNKLKEINFRRSKLRGIEFGIFIFLISVASYGELNL